MSIGEVPRAFDQISSAYDETREPLAPETVGKLADLLRESGVSSLLEVGVGTGRIAAPLQSQGFALTGVDASLGMLSRARPKGLDRLVRGSAYALPFGDRTVDATLFVHVLHLLDQPRRALGEATRVGRHGAFALVHPAGERPDRDPSAPDGPRRIVYRILAERGYPIPERGQGGPPRRERVILTTLPPDRLTVLSDQTVTEPLAKRLDTLERGGNRHTLHVPREELVRAVAEARREVGDRVHTYRRVQALATWSAETVASAPAAPVAP